EPLITETLKLEETSFKQILGRGLKLLEEETAKLGAGAPFPGEAAFKLYDTYGFPLDLTQDVLRAQGRQVAIDAFNAAMERQRAEARKHWVGSGEAATEQLWFELRDELGASEFLGYETHVAEGKIVALVVDGKRVAEAKAGQDAAILVNQTPFYAESGGQVGDTGVMFSSAGGEFAELRIDESRRAQLRANHSVTHLLHQALRRRLGEHVTQKGSLVAPDRLRFDFSHPRALSSED